VIARAFRFSLLVFWAGFLGIFVPGHTRGAITLPGAGCSDCKTVKADSCCATDTTTERDEPTQDQKKRCAVCFFVMSLYVVPPFVLDVRAAGLVAVLPLRPPAVVGLPTLDPTYWGRGPPTD